MKITYVKPDIQVFEIERQVILTGSVKAKIDDEKDIDYGGSTSSYSIWSAD